MRRYGKRDVRAATEARELQRRLGYPPAQVVAKVVVRGVLNNAVTAQSVRMAEAIFGPDVKAMRWCSRNG